MRIYFAIRRGRALKESCEPHDPQRRNEARWRRDAGRLANDSLRFTVRECSAGIELLQDKRAVYQGELDRRGAALTEDEKAWRQVQDERGLYVHEIGRHDYPGPDEWSEYGCARHMHESCRI